MATNRSIHDAGFTVNDYENISQSTGLEGPINVYLSHAIRGPLQGDATFGTMRRNNKIASMVANDLRLRFSYLDIYVPGEQDGFPQQALQRGVLTMPEVLYVDIDIMRGHDLCLCFWPYGIDVMGGVAKEKEAAAKASMGWLQFSSLDDTKNWDYRIFLDAMIAGATSLNSYYDDRYGPEKTNK